VTLNAEELTEIVRFAVTPASLSTQKLGGIPSVPDEKDVTLTMKSLRCDNTTSN
jgi:hypothetical protein